MKQIQPVNIWQAGVNKQGTILSSYVISDNLLSSATFYYSIASDSLEPLSQGNLTMTGEAYDIYNSNEDAWAWIETQLGVTIIGDVTTTSSTTLTPDPIPA